MKAIIPLILSILVLGSCTKTKLNPVQYKQYIENPRHGLYVEKNLGEYIFGLQYKPLEFVSMLDQRNNDTIPLTNKSDQYTGLEHFTLKIKRVDGQSVLKQGGKSLQVYYDLISYFSYGIQNDLSLIIDHDTFSCAISQFERTFEVNPGITILLGFATNIDPEYKNDRTLIFKDHLLGTGTIKIRVKGKNIRNAPGLKI